MPALLASESRMLLAIEPNESRTAFGRRLRISSQYCNKLIKLYLNMEKDHLTERFGSLRPDSRYVNDS